MVKYYIPLISVFSEVLKNFKRFEKRSVKLNFKEFSRISKDKLQEISKDSNVRGFKFYI